MKTTFTLICFFAWLFATPLVAQIPNAGFENWTGGNPDDWLTNNVPTVIAPVTQETPSYSGTYALRGEVMSFAGSPFAPVLASTDMSANGFPVSQTYSAFSFYYKLNVTGTARLEATVAFYDAGGGWVGGGNQNFTGTVSSYALANIPISYIGPNPVECVIIFAIYDTIAPDPPVGNYFIVDALSFSGTSAVHGIAQNLLQAYSFPNPAGDFITLHAGIPLTGLVEISVYDLCGKLVQTSTSPTSNHPEIRLSLAGLPAGVYSVKLSNGTKQWTTKLIRQ